MRKMSKRRAAYEAALEAQEVREAKERNEYVYALWEQEQAEAESRWWDRKYSEYLAILGPDADYSDTQASDALTWDYKIASKPDADQGDLVA